MLKLQVISVFLLVSILTFGCNIGLENVGGEGGKCFDSDPPCDEGLTCVNDVCVAPGDQDSDSDDTEKDKDVPTNDGDKDVDLQDKDTVGGN